MQVFGLWRWLVQRFRGRELEHVEKHLSKDFEVWIVCQNHAVLEDILSNLVERMKMKIG
ncbi:hypothetical protein [Salinigranum salinum]|uniref:hypothetical protein n=1 Tax=Salinigranum salinum TaxID=1364937 RepID=UPI0018648AC8|nr:hypothetical protein [Salinigranum salinum]